MHLGDATKPYLTRRASQHSCRTHRAAAFQLAKSCTPSLRAVVSCRASQPALPAACNASSATAARRQQSKPEQHTRLRRRAEQRDAKGATVRRRAARP